MRRRRVMMHSMTFDPPPRSSPTCAAQYLKDVRSPPPEARRRVLRCPISQKTCATQHLKRRVLLIDHSRQSLRRRTSKIQWASWVPAGRNQSQMLSLSTTFPACDPEASYQACYNLPRLMQACQPAKTMQLASLNPLLMQACQPAKTMQLARLNPLLRQTAKTVQVASLIQL